MAKHNRKAKARLAARIKSWEDAKSDPGRGLVYFRPGSMKK